MGVTERTLRRTAPRKGGGRVQSLLQAGPQLLHTVRPLHAHLRRDNLRQRHRNGEPRRQTRASACSATSPSWSPSAAPAASAWCAARWGRWSPRTTLYPTSEVLTTCCYCATGCSMYLGVRDGKIVSVRGNREGKANRGKLCVKGRFGISEFVQHTDRLTSPLIRGENGLAAAGWDEASRSGGRKVQILRRRMRSPSSLPPAAPTKTSTWRKSWRGRCWAPTTWTTAPASDMLPRWPVWPPSSAQEP